MKNKTIYLLLFVFATLTTSCSSDDESSDNNTESSELVCGKDISIVSGTICCVTGSDFASPGETLSFVYGSNTNNSIFNWTISSGSISIVSGENSQTVTVKFGDDFTNGKINCYASGDLECEADIEITEK
jgi:hypothetical protein|tara:strand:+ start:95 stop:484 length:390 start_codon:yes stop_codon:yes gene_type:complete